MNNTNNMTATPKRIPWATASFVLSLVGWVFALFLFLLDKFNKDMFFWSILCWFLSFVFGIVALVEISRKFPAFKGKAEAITGICASVIPLFLIGCIISIIFLALRGEPYDESHPALVISTIETNFNFKFPEKIEFLKAADRIAGGVPPQAYVFIVSFTTDQNGFDQLRDSL